MLENLLSTLPPVLVEQRTGKTCYLTIGATDEGWGAMYLDWDGQPVNSLKGFGINPIEAVQDLQQSIQLERLWFAPAVKVDEVTGRML